MKKLKNVFWLTLITLLTTPLQTQPQNEWTILIEPVYMSMYNDFRSGDIYTHYVTELDIPRSGSNPGERTIIYGTLYDPIILTMPNKLTLVGELNYNRKKSKWGFGMRSWKFKNSTREGDTITQLDTKHNEDGSVTRFTRGIRMLNYMFEPFNKSGDMPTDWWAKKYLRIWIREIYVSCTFSNALNARFGIKAAKTINSHDIGQRHWTSREKNRTFAQTSEINYLVIGPNLGFDIHTKHFAVLAQQSVLFGTVMHTGLWEVTNYTIEDGTETIDTSEKSYGIYNIPLKVYTKEIIPATELNIKLFFKEKKLTYGRSIKFGASLFASVLWQAPIAPNWRVGERNWFEKREDIILSGAALNMEIKF